MFGDMGVFAVLTGVIVPLLVGVVTKLNASSGVKAVMNLGLTALGAYLNAASETTVWDWKVFFVTFGISWAISIATYYGFYKPTTISVKVQESTANFGVG